MKNTGFNKKTIFLLILFAFILFFTTLFTKNDDYIKDELKYIKSLNINLSGKVVDLNYLDYGHGYGIITVDINESSIKELDERKERERYLGLIKNEVGYFVLGTMSDFKLGDSIVIKSNVYDLYRNNSSVVKAKNIFLPSDKFLNPYKEVNKRLNYIK